VKYGSGEASRGDPGTETYFLNHLQVISGFLQLNKPDRIREYIELVTVEMRVMSKQRG
jgi:hypothetical protein